MMCDKYQFDLFNNVVNKDITIIKEINSGFYNITHSRNIIHSIRQKENKTTKEIRNWFGLKDSENIVNNFKKVLNIDNVSFILNKGVDNNYRGTYVHKDLYQWILQWLDFEYAIMIIRMINKLQEEYIISTKIQLKEKDCKIDQLIKKIDNQTELINNQSGQINTQSDQIKEQSSQIKELLGYAKETKEELEYTNAELMETNNELNEIHIKVEEIRDVVHERNYNVNIDPVNEDLKHYFSIIKSENNKVRMISGQRMYVERTYNSTYSNNELLLDCIYCPNPTSLKSRLKQKIFEINREFKQKILDAYKSKLIDGPEKNNQMTEFRRNPPIKSSYTIVSFNVNNYSMDDIINLFLSLNEERNELPVP